MNDFLKFFDEKVCDFPMHLEIYYSKVMNWCISITKKGCAENYQEAKTYGNDVEIVNVQAADMELCFARAHVALKDWLLKYMGGY